MKTVAENIRSAIEHDGVLPFARFMELALYHPNGGYYETIKNPGRCGDFYTSVSAGELFGQLLSFQFSTWLDEMRSAECGTRIVEAGAHDGRLAADILGWLQVQRPKLFSEIEYIILEPSPHRRQWQKETLKSFAPRARWCSDFQDLAELDTAGPATPHAALHAPHLRGIIFSNELLDAMPVRRLGWDAKCKKWFEWGVTFDGEKFVWARIQKPDSDLPSSILHLPSSLLEVLPDGYTIECSPAAENWWRSAAGVLGRGKLLTIDYGLAGGEVFSPSRPRGTLRAYRRHRVADDVLACPGEQDITAHVNFSAIQKAGEEAGLKTDFFGAQAKFLTEILASATRSNSLGDWGAKQPRQFQTLTHPEHLGRAFRVLVQSR